MSTWLKLLPLFSEEVKNLIEPTEEVKEGEKVVGVISDDLKKLYTLWRGTKKSADMLVVEQEYKKVDQEERGRVSEFKSKARALELLFWIGVCDELGLWGHPDLSAGIRVGWKAVEVKLPESPFRFFFPENK